MSEHKRTLKHAVKINGLNVKPGTELSFKHVAGRFRFVSATCKDGDIVYLTVYGGAYGRTQFRSFYPQQVRHVHTKNKLRSNAK